MNKTAAFLLILLATPALAQNIEKYFGLEVPVESCQKVMFDNFAESDDLHSSPTFSPDGLTAFWSDHIESQDLMVIKYSVFKDDVWTAPEIAPFSGDYWDDAPIFTPDGSRLIFMSKRPEPGKEHTNKYLLWEIDSKNFESNNPICLGVYGDTPSADESGNLYCTNYGNDSYGDYDIYIYPVADQYQTRQNLGSTINSAASEFTPCLAPDGSYLIYSAYNRPEGNGLFLSFRNTDGSWAKPIYINDLIGLKEFARFPKVSSDGQVLYLNSGNTFYWISTRFIDDLR